MSFFSYFEYLSNLSFRFAYGLSFVFAGPIGLLPPAAGQLPELCAAVWGDLRHLEADEGDVRDEFGEFAEGGDAEPDGV